MSHAFDAIVIGAGPSGSTVARYLAHAGIKTALLEKQKLPRYKPCGGGVTHKVRDVLDLDFSTTIEDTICRTSFGLGSNYRFSTEPGAVVGWCVMRDRFDLLLADSAVKAGADLRDGFNVTHVEVEEGGVQVYGGREKLDAQAIVGADGSTGIVARAIQLRGDQPMAAALEMELQVPVSSLQRWRGTWHADLAAATGGYGWIFPKSDHLSVGVANMIYPQKRQDLRRLLDRFIACEETLREGKCMLSRGARLPLGGHRGPVHRPRELLAGDAAGVADPITGEGIFQAIRSARIAADEILSGFAAGEFTFADYSRRIYHTFNRDYDLARRLARIVYSIPFLTIRVLRYSSMLQHKMIRLATDSHLTYRQLLFGV